MLGYTPPGPAAMPGKPPFSVDTLIQYCVTGVFSAEYAGERVTQAKTIQNNSAQPERNLIFPNIQILLL
jgi:hypothetical protein